MNGETDAVTVFLIDDEPDVTRALAWLLESVKIDARCHTDASAFLDAIDHHAGPACAILDLRMPKVSGIELLQRLRQRRADVPAIFLSAHADVPTAVCAMRLGAFDFLQKPFNPQVFLDCVQRASRFAREHHAQRQQQLDHDEALQRLSTREREIFAQILEGASSKEIARRLGISPKTVETHRASVLHKLGARNARALILRWRHSNGLDAAQ